MAGHEYTGTRSVTENGIQCQSWSANTPHVPGAFNDFPDESREAASNYCRNPDPGFTTGAWCYTMDPNVRWGHCDVPTCGTYARLLPVVRCILVDL